ncbi:hypothetical protein Fmac_021653 [Flemingia macrophylla]|uniref:PGG domain-containing protein n=1 Tax=Flemingia macrophylla TaxID=520843 RepID=A0ABD1LXG8_9FABA
MDSLGELMLDLSQLGLWEPKEFSFEEVEGFGEELASLNVEKITFPAETVSRDGVAVVDFCSNIGTLFTISHSLSLNYVQYLIKEEERFNEEFARVLCEAVAARLGEKWARLGEEQARLEDLERYFENLAKDCEAMKDIKIQIFESNTHEVDYYGLSNAIMCPWPSDVGEIRLLETCTEEPYKQRNEYDILVGRKGTGSESKILPRRNRWKAVDSSGKITSQLGYPTMYDGEPFSLGKRTAVQCVSSFFIAAIPFLWIISDICSQLSIFQLEQRHILSSLLRLFGFTVFVCAVTTMVVVGAPFSRMQRTMLMFWAILMLVRSAMSLTTLYVSMLAIILMGWHVLFEKQTPHGG